MRTKRIERMLLIALNAFLAVTAVVGGIGLLTGSIPLPLALLQGSPFSTYTIPGLTLLVIVGGSALVATGLMLRRHAFGTLVSILTGVMIMCFEMVEVLVIGSEPGLMRNLQVFYFVLGVVIVLLATWVWAIELTGGLRRGAVHELWIG